MKLPYSEGSAFLVPLRDRGFARGVVARMAPKGRFLFGYFFGPRLPSIEGATLDNLDPAKAILRLRFGDLGLITHKWPILGIIPKWDRSKWAMPDFARRPPGMKPLLVRYSDIDPSRIEAEHPIDNDSGLPVDASSGQGAVEIKLSKLLD
jgi:hypothetical protein